MEVAPVIRIAAPASRAVVPGSYLAIMHPASDLDPALLEAGQRWNQLAAQPVRLRSRADMTRFLAGLELVEPGLVTVPEWRPDASARPAQAKADMSHRSHVHLVSIATARHFHLSWRW
jgi:S-adenosyl methyltransferase